MQVEVLFFGILKDVVGRSRDRLEAPEGARLETVFEHYASQFPRLRQMSPSIVLARNQEFAARDERVADGDEIAFMPPVSGGSDGWLAIADEGAGFYAVTRAPLEPAHLARRLQAPEDGAVLTFEGVVRNHSADRKTLFLEYECYPPLAVKAMQRIGAELLERLPVRAVGMIHRVGRLEIGEASIAIVVCGAHRRPAYEASLEAINRVKRLVPVWKKEHFEDGEVWVEGEWDDSLPTPAPAAT